MRVADMLVLYDYNYWATDRILRAAAGITDEQFRAPAAFPHGGVRGTLTHALSAESGWRARLQGGGPYRPLPEDTFPTVAALAAAWRADEAAMRAYLATLSDDGLSGSLRFTRSNGDTHTSIIWHLLVHVVNHGTQHRAEAAAQLTDYGHSPGDLDLFICLLERGL
jgi:uncharacterized damage-inducible protein DinB